MIKDKRQKQEILFNCVWTYYLHHLRTLHSVHNLHNMHNLSNRYHIGPFGSIMLAQRDFQPAPLNTFWCNSCWPNVYDDSGDDSSDDDIDRRWWLSSRQPESPSRARFLKWSRCSSYNPAAVPQIALRRSGNGLTRVQNVALPRFLYF